MPAFRSQAGMVGRKIGMMRLYDGAGQSRGVTVIQLDSNYITQVRTPERDGYSAVQIGYPGNRKRLNRPQRGHLRAVGLEGRAPVLSGLQEFRLNNVASYETGQLLRVEQFEAGTFVDVTATSKGRGFQGGVKRHNFAGGPKTHGQSDRHRAPGSIGSGTTPGRVYKGLKMAGHMGNETVTVLNLLVVAVDPSRSLLFVEGSVPGHRDTVVVVGSARRKPLTGYVAPMIRSAEVDAVVADEVVTEDPIAEDVATEDAAIEDVVTDDEAPAAEETAEEPVAEEAAEAAATDEQPADEAAAADDENKSEA